MMDAVLSLLQQAQAAKLPSFEPGLFRPGQVLEALVLGQAAGDLTQIRIGGLTVLARLPAALAAGTTLQLAVKAAGSTPQLAILSQKPAAFPPVQLQAPVPVLLTEGLQVTITQPLVGQIAQQPQALAPSGSRIDSAILAQTTNVAPPKVRAVPPPTAPANSSAPIVMTPNAAAARPVSPRPSVVALGAGPKPGMSPALRPTPVEVARPLPVPIPSPIGSSPPPLRAGQGVAPANVASGGPTVSPATLAPTASSTLQAPIQTPSPRGPAISPAAPAAPNSRVAPTQTAPAQTVSAEIPASVVRPALVAPVVTEPARAPAVASPLSPPAREQQASASQVVAGRSPPVPAQPATPPSQPPATPQAALSQMIPAALARQDSVGTLLQTLTMIAARGIVLPEPVVRAAAQVMSNRTMAGAGQLTGPVLRAAVQRSGVLLEAALAGGSAPNGDAKAGLLALKSALFAWLGGDPAPVEPVRRVPPPVRGEVPRMQIAQAPPLPDELPGLGRLLHGQSEAALSRLKLLQLASLPDANSARPAGPELRLELPLMLGGALAMLQLQVSRDGGRRDAPRQRGWVMRFALDSAATGEVGAEVALRGKAISVALWAADPETATALAEMLPELGESLAAMGLDPGAIRCRRGVPRIEAAPVGRFLDNVS